jgi:hypothetical protein
MTASGQCVFCVYRASALGWLTDNPAALAKRGRVVPPRPIERATNVITTPNGPRDLCEEHARSGRWR